MGMRSVNKAMILGAIGKDAVTSFTPSGIPKTTFSVATTYRFKKGDEWEEETTWHNVVLWRSENLANFLQKGKQVFIEGRISNRKYEKNGETRYISEIVADNVVLAGGTGEKAATIPSTQPKRPISADLEINDDDVPF